MNYNINMEYEMDYESKKQAEKRMRKFLNGINGVGILWVVVLLCSIVSDFKRFYEILFEEWEKCEGDIALFCFLLACICLYLFVRTLLESSLEIKEKLTKRGVACFCVFNLVYIFFVFAYCYKANKAIDFYIFLFLVPSFIIILLYNSKNIFI